MQNHRPLHFLLVILYSQSILASNAPWVDPCSDSRIFFANELISGGRYGVTGFNISMRTNNTLAYVWCDYRKWSCNASPLELYFFCEDNFGLSGKFGTGPSNQLLCSDNRFGNVYGPRDDTSVNQLCKVLGYDEGNMDLSAHFPFYGCYDTVYDAATSTWKTSEGRTRVKMIEGITCTRTTRSPTRVPSRLPTAKPSRLPTSSSPSSSPSVSPTSSSPTFFPSRAPTSSTPTASPSTTPTTSAPSQVPTSSAPSTSSPSASPTHRPTSVPTFLTTQPQDVSSTVSSTTLFSATTTTTTTKASTSTSTSQLANTTLKFTPNSNSGSENAQSIISVGSVAIGMSTSNLIVYFLFATLLSCVLIACCYNCIPSCEEKTKIMLLVSALCMTFDFLTDVMFAFVLFGAGQTLYFGISAASIFLPLVYSLVAWSFQLTTWKKYKPAFYPFLWAWLDKYNKVLYILSIFTGSTFGAFTFHNTHLFGLDLFTMNVPKHYMNTFLEKRILIAFLENVPQLILQVIWATQFPLGIIPFAAMFSSTFSLIGTVYFGIMKCLRKSALETYELSFEISIIDMLNDATITKGAVKRAVVKLLEEDNLSTIGQLFDVNVNFAGTRAGNGMGFFVSAFVEVFTKTKGDEAQEVLTSIMERKDILQKLVRLLDLVKTVTVRVQNVCVLDLDKVFLPEVEIARSQSSQRPPIILDL